MPTPATLTHATRRKAVAADLLLFSVAIFWGSNFVFIKSVVERTTAIAGGSIVAGAAFILAGVLVIELMPSRGDGPPAPIAAMPRAD